MGKYAPYPAYIPQIDEWLSRLPEKWQIVSLKRLLAVKVSDGPHETPQFQDDGIPFLSVDGIQENRLVFDGCRYVTEHDHQRYSRKCKPQYGDVLLGKAASVGKVAFVDTEKEFNVWSPLAVIRPKRESAYGRYVFYAIQSKYLQSQCIVRSNSNTQQNLGMGDIENLKLPTAPPEEQNTIVSFLDHETAKIDLLIAKQQRLIELLKEKRQAVISHAVTKGLNPDAPMKDSGVEWLGEVPAHWDVLKTKRFFRLVSEPAPNNNDYELLSIYTDIGVRPRKELEQKGNKATTTDGYWIVRRGDIIVNKLLAWMGATGFSEYEGVTSPAYDILRKTKQLNPRFYHYLFRTKIAQTEFKRWSRGIMEMRLRLYFDELGRIDMPFPPVEEQDQIVSQIQELELKYEIIIEKALTSISLLKEHRTALISAAVTGKIDVRGWQRPNTEEIAAAVSA